MSSSIFDNMGMAVIGFLVALMIIVFIHELGHYLVGRWCGIHAEKFSIGFGKPIWQRTDKRGTVWQVAPLPLGGYVKFAGDADAASYGSEDVSELSPEARRRTMPGAPIWARSLTVAAGPVFNFILSAAIYMGAALWVGQATEPVTVGEVVPLPPAFGQGLQVGDQLVSINGKPATTFDEMSEATSGLEPSASIPYVVLRDGVEMEVDGPPPMPPIASSISPRSAADRAKLLPGDVISAIDGTPIWTFQHLIDVVKETDGKPVDLTVWRDGQEFELNLTPKRTDLPKPGGGFETRLLIGISSGAAFTPETVTPSLWDAFKGAWEQVWYIITMSLNGFWGMMTGQISLCNLSSPVGMADAAGSMIRQGSSFAINFVAFLSTAVGLLNLFPIPILDGGHLVFHAYEGVTGRTPSERALNVAMAIGLALITTMMVVALLNDLIFC